MGYAQFVQVWNQVGGINKPEIQTELNSISRYGYGQQTHKT